VESAWKGGNIINSEFNFDFLRHVVAPRLRRSDFLLL